MNMPTNNSIFNIETTMKLTAQVQLLPTAYQISLLIKTIAVFNMICNYVSKIAFDNIRI